MGAFFFMLFVGIVIIVELVGMFLGVVSSRLYKAYEAVSEKEKLKSKIIKISALIMLYMSLGMKFYPLSMILYLCVDEIIYIIIIILLFATGIIGTAICKIFEWHIRIKVKQICRKISLYFLSTSIVLLIFYVINAIIIILLN